MYSLILNVVKGLLDCKLRCSSRKTVSQSLKMMYGYSIMLSIRTPQASLWELSEQSISNDRKLFSRTVLKNISLLLKLLDKYENICYNTYIN